MSAELRRFWRGSGFVVAALATLLWLKYQGSQTANDIVGSLILIGADCFIGFYCIRFLAGHQHYRHSVDGNVVLARAKSRSWFYVGIVCIGAGVVAQASVLLNL